MILEEALKPMLKEGADTLVMGCTHFPFVIPLIREIAGEDVRVIDPAPAVARQVKRVLEAGGLLRASDSVGKTVFLTSAEAGKLEALLPKLLGMDSAVRRLHWRNGELVEQTG